MALFMLLILPLPFTIKRKIFTYVPRHTASSVGHWLM